MLAYAHLLPTTRNDQIQFVSLLRDLLNSSHIVQQVAFLCTDFNKRFVLNQRDGFSPPETDGDVRNLSSTPLIDS